MIAPKDLWYCYQQGKLVESAEQCRQGIRVAVRGLPIDPDYDRAYGIRAYFEQETQEPKPKKRKEG